MPVVITKLAEQIDSNLAAGGLSAVACCQLTNAKTILNNNKVFSVQSLSDLPNVAENIGRLVYVRNIGAYRFSDGICWKNNIETDPTVIRRELWVWGCNTDGRLGLGSSLITACRSPVREFCSANNWCNISFGVNASASASINTSGQLWTWGSNSNGLLGIGNSVTLGRCSPVREFCSASDWCQVSTSAQSMLSVKNTGQLWVWGINTNGRLGDGTVTTRCSPVREFCSATDWCQVSTGQYSTSAVKTSGQIWSWGSNTQGLLGIGSSATIGRCSPVREFCSATDWCQVSTGYRHVAALKTSGQIWSWGSNVDGGLGIGSSATIGRCSPIREFCSATDWCQVSAGGNFTAAIKTSGQLWVWGNNTSGRLGIGSSATIGRCSPVREFCSATDWRQVSVSNSDALVVKTSGQLWGWGGNGSTIGDGTSTVRCSPVREFCISTEWVCVSTMCLHTLAIKYVKSGFII